MRVLVIDDDDVLLRSLTRVLDPPHRVTTSNATRALVLLQKESFDAILCDIAMPDIDGPALVAQLAPEIATRVVFMTGGGRIPEWIVVAHRILFKPFPRDQVLQALAVAAGVEHVDDA